ncbi:MAG: rhodanese-like domain-containing protein [Armatimonadetes bacterium]|nr:rhodanese-like domain-containing protein [Armatimonadota bacterium]
MALDEGARYQLVDVRSPQEYATGHVPRAINLPLEQVEARLDDVHRQDPLVLICQSGQRAQMACNLLEHYRDDLILLEGGTGAWINSDLPVIAATSTRLRIIRQVQLIAGPLILIGSILAATVDVKWAILSGFIGAGLTFAGATGHCGMALLLGKLPWNRARQAECAGETTTGATRWE